MIEAAWGNPGFLDLLVHFPDYLADIISRYQGWTYVLMFGILAAETGLVFFGWLPGDTMLFTAGILASGEALDLRIVLPLMSLAAFTGDQLNYLMGRGLARRAGETSASHRSTKPGKVRDRIEKAKRLYARHGGQMVIIGRFIPVLSSLAPLAAAVSGMGYRRFFPYSAAGCLLWTGVFTLTGYFFGKIPMVREHFWISIFGVILFSILSALAGSWWQGREGHG